MSCGKWTLRDTCTHIPPYAHRIRTPRVSWYVWMFVVDGQFWTQGYWKEHLNGKPYHVSALYRIDLEAIAMECDQA